MPNLHIRIGTPFYLLGNISAEIARGVNFTDAGSQYRLKPPQLQQSCRCGHGLIEFKLKLEILHMTVWATEDDTERVKVFMEFREQPVVGSETANQETSRTRLSSHDNIHC